MSIRTKKHLLLPLLALSVTLVMVVSAQAQNRHEPASNGTSATLQITFGSAPHWVGVPGTRVREIRDTDRPDYDMFSYGGNYYAYNNNHWYRSRRAHGRFMMIDDSRVPNQLSRVPREHWRNYPSGWGDQNGNRHYGASDRRNPGDRQLPPGDNHDHK